MDFSQQNKPLEWITDVDEKYLSDSQAFYLKNREFFINIHGAKFNGQNLGKSTPVAANYPACDLQMPGGENYSIGIYSCDRTSEVYVFVLNSNKVSFIYRVNATDCHIVYDEPCYQPSAEPKNAITQWRVWLDVKQTCKNWGGKRLFFTDGIFLGCIDVEAAIATDSFTTPFFEDCSDPCDYVSLCTATPFTPIRAEYLPKTDADKLLANKIVDIGFQFMYRWVYYDGRTSVWSEASSYYYQSAGECFETQDGLSRCLKLKIPFGNAMVSYIELAYRTDNFNQWFLAESIEKYRQYNNSQQQWYERQISPIVQNGYSNVDCSFDYTFCNDKECLAIAKSESDKVFIPFPREAQGLIPFKDSILFYNYLSGNCPLPRSVIDNVKIELDCSNTNTETTCNKAFAEVTVYSVIHDFWHDRNQFIYTLESDPVGKTKWFGGLEKSELDGGFETGWNQRFTSPVNNFIAYVEGTQYYSEMKQYKRNPNGIIEEYLQVTDMSTPSTQRSWRSFRKSGGIFFQKAVIRVPKGTKGFIRLTGHNETFANDTKSTFVEGIVNMNNYSGESNLGGVINPGNFNPKQEEIYFDTCLGNQNLIAQAFIIKDNAIDGGAGSAYANKSSAVSGYLYDDNNEPITGANIYSGGTITPSFGNTTDHNGFFHIVMPGVDGDLVFTVKAEIDCSPWAVLKTETISMSKGEMTLHDIKISNANYTNNKIVTVKINVLDCVGNQLPGVRVAMSGSKSSVTDNFGVAKFKLRNYFTRDRIVKAVIMDKNGCFETDCDGSCNPCLPTIDYTLPNCFLGTQVYNLRALLVNVTATKAGATLKAGGRYGFGAIVKGDCGQLSFVNKGIYLDIPKKCGVNDDVCMVKYNLSNVVLPAWAKSITIVRTKNLNPFELQWIVDKAEYKGNKITLTIQSLNDYNFNSFFATNTIYQYLKGDRVEIIADSKGKYYCQSLNYQILSPFHDKIVSGDSKIENFFNQIIIEDDGRVGKIEEGTIIELQRPQECKTEEAYYSVGAQFNTTLLPNNTRIVVNPIGVFSTFDTYTVRRKIGKSVPIAFEHHSPSDFWGDKVSDTGQVYIVNQFEDEVRKDRNITISAANDFNYFGDLEKTIGDAQQGGLVAGNITDDKVLLWICENDNFINQTADDLLKVSANGTVTAITGDDVLSNPQPKVAGKFGCQYAHIGSIYFGDGFATWADVNKHAYIKHDYQQAVDVSFGKIKAWTSLRFQEIETWNRLQEDPLDKYRFATGYNHLNKEVFLTLKQLRQSGIDNELEPFISKNETIIFRPEDDKFYGQSSCTPEAYGMLNSFNGKGCTHLVVQNGIAWLHPIIPEKVGSFFGVPVDQVIGICLNKYPEKIKVGLAIEIQDEILWFAHKITTDNPKFESEIPAVRWKKTEYKHNAEFLCNKNGRGGLYGNMKNFAGEKPNGYFISIIFIRDNTQELKYNTIDDNKRQLYSELDMISFKFLLSEESGFSENL